MDELTLEDLRVIAASLFAREMECERQLGAYTEDGAFRDEMGVQYWTQRYREALRASSKVAFIIGTKTYDEQ